MKFSIFLLTLVSTTALSQNILFTKDGNRIPYKKIKIDKDKVEIVADNKTRKSFSTGEVAGYFNDKQQKKFYRVPIVKDYEKRFELFNARDENEHEFLERVKAGAIDLYVRLETQSPPTTMGPDGRMTTGSGGTRIYYYAQDDHDYKNIFITGLLTDKTKGYQNLQDFVDDDEEILKQIRHEDFRYNEKNMLRIIEAYTVRKWKKVTAEDYEILSRASIYTMAKAELKQQFKVTVNDSLEFKLPENRMPLPLNLPGKAPSKVCINWDTGSSCRIIDPNPSGMHYYELDYISGSKSIEIKDRTLQDFKNYMVKTSK